MKNKLEIYKKAILWIRENTIEDKGMTVTSKQKRVYPEVTGYYIPSLLEWGERKIAVSYAEYLCTIQKKNGAWYDSNDKEPYVFDTAQILKGLISIRSIIPAVDENIIKGCNWLISNVEEDGHLITPSRNAWGDDETFCSELIHLYCLSPLVDAAEIYRNKKYKDIADKVKNYYITNYKNEIYNFNLLSHFYAYVIEGLIDLGEVDIARDAMNNIKRYQSGNNGIPGLNNVKWVCSTGLFQLALIWYKLGELEEGNKIFNYACSLQNKTGGWYGSYSGKFIKKIVVKKKKAYFPNQEISWANKYFLDSLGYKERLEFEKQSTIFADRIQKEDGRYQLVKCELNKIQNENNSKGLCVCDVGCGKGRYLKNLIEDIPQHSYFAMDLSEKVMKMLPGNVEKKQGRLTQIPYKDNKFDFVYVCEALEHAINLRGAINELWRILKRGGEIVIIDKPIEKMGKMKLDEWEQWIDDVEMQEYVGEIGGKLKIIKTVPYIGKHKNLFRAWIIRK